MRELSYTIMFKVFLVSIILFQIEASTSIENFSPIKAITVFLEGPGVTSQLPTTSRPLSNIAATNQGTSISSGVQPSWTGEPITIKLGTNYHVKFTRSKPGNKGEPDAVMVEERHKQIVTPLSPSIATATMLSAQPTDAKSNNTSKSKLSSPIRLARTPEFPITNSVENSAVWWIESYIGISLERFRMHLDTGGGISWVYSTRLSGNPLLHQAIIDRRISLRNCDQIPYPDLKWRVSYADTVSIEGYWQADIYRIGSVNLGEINLPETFIGCASAIWEPRELHYPTDGVLALARNRGSSQTPKSDTILERIYSRYNFQPVYTLDFYSTAYEWPLPVDSSMTIGTCTCDNENTSSNLEVYEHRDGKYELRGAYKLIN